MTNRFKLVFGLSAFALCAGAVESAPAALRWRASGNACVPGTENTKFSASVTQGLGIIEDPGAINADDAVCAIPLGPQLVDLGDGSGNEIAHVNMRLSQEVVAANLRTYVRVHDYGELDWCTCGSASGSVAAGAHAQRSMPFDCGACSYGTDWGLVAELNRDGAGTTYVKLISVYD